MIVVHCGSADKVISFVAAAREAAFWTWWICLREIHAAAAISAGRAAARVLAAEGRTTSEAAWLEANEKILP